MTLWKRIKNLIELSKIEITPKQKGEIYKVINKETPKMARVIKMHDPIDNFLKEDDVQTL